MEINTVFWLVLLAVVATGLCCMGYCKYISEKKPQGEVDKV